jgi:hypothetical protein
MSDRMEKTREALEALSRSGYATMPAAALAEVEEWEAEAERLDTGWTDELNKRVLVEAERDRLKTLEPYAHYAHSEGCAANGWAANASPCDCGLDALLARAALGEQT